MNVLHKIWKKHVPGLHKDKRGIAAVEFALILPLMITAYLGVSEISELLTADRRVVTLARALSDLTAQYSKVSDDDLTNILTVANPVMVPFNASTVKIALSSIIFNTNPAVGQNAASLWHHPGCCCEQYDGKHNQRAHRCCRCSHLNYCR